MVPQDHLLQLKVDGVYYTCFPYRSLVFTIVHVCVYSYLGDKLIADDDDKQQQLLNYVIQVCRPKDWQISLLEDRLAKRQPASFRYHSQKRLDNVLKGGLDV